MPRQQATFNTKTVKPESPMQTYLHDINNTPLLDPAEEKELAARIALGDPWARDHMVKANLRLVVNIARGYVGRGVSFEDLIEEGNLGLMRAVEAFDDTMETRFSTYASYWIKQSIRRAVINQGKPIRVSAQSVSLLARWKRAHSVLSEQLGRTAFADEVDKALNFKPKKRGSVRKALVAEGLHRVGSTSEEDSEWSVLDSLADETTTSAEKRVEDKDHWEQVLSLLENMDQRQAIVIRGRFGLDDGNPKTLCQLGRELGVCRERVRQFEYSALVKLGMPEVLPAEGNSSKAYKKPNGKSKPRTPAGSGTNGTAPHVGEPAANQEAPADQPLVNRVIDGVASKKARKAANASNNKLPRRRKIDPTTCDRQQTAAEIEIGNTMMDFGRRIGRPHLTAGEILAEAKKALGYKRVPPNSNQDDCGDQGDSVTQGDSAAQDELDAKEFAVALVDYKQRSGRQFPTWSEVLEVMLSLGYRKCQATNNE